MYLLFMTALFTIIGAEDVERYCPLCTPGTISGDLANHTMCLYEGVGPACLDSNDAGVTDEEKELILQEHNRLRTYVASGSEIRGFKNTGPQPPAADMMKLKWDEELAKIAQLWADQCTYGHDCRHVPDFKVGQNVAQYWHSIEAKVDWKFIIESWYGEVENWTATDTPKFRLIADNPPIGHYTQIVWGNTRFVGCGRRAFRVGPWHEQLYVCNYGPSGNYLFDPLYIIGDPCTQCPQDSVCTDEFLCEAGAGGVKDIYAYRYSESDIKSSTIIVENATAVQEENEVNTDSENNDKPLWDRWITYFFIVNPYG